MAHSKTAVSRRKARPKEQREDFPLFPHAAGYWAKKVKGRLLYFGKVAVDPEGEKALAVFLKHKDTILLTGRIPEDRPDVFTVEDLCDHFLNAKRPLVALARQRQK